jgi:hypothetical protein
MPEHNPNNIAWLIQGQTFKLYKLAELSPRNNDLTSQRVFGCRRLRPAAITIAPIDPNPLGSGTGSSRNAKLNVGSGPAPSGSKLPVPTISPASLIPRASLRTHPLDGSMRLFKSIAEVPPGTHMTA